MKIIGHYSVYLLLIFCFFFTFTFAQTGPKSPASILSDNSYGVTTWTNPANAATSDGFFANASLSTMGQPTFYLKATNFGFALNPCDDINGIEVRVEWSQTATTVVQDKVYLVIGGTVSTLMNRSTGAALPNPESITTFGGPTDTWGQTLKGSDINNAGFGAAISVIRNSGATASANVDHITITVYHSTPPPMTYNSSTVSQVTLNVNPNTQNNQIIRVDVTTNSGCPSINATSFTFNMNGTNALSDIANAKLFFTGTNAAFISPAQLGNTVASPTYSDFSISGFTQPLANGTNYFWLATDVAAGATVGNFVDAECTSMIVDGISRTPSTIAPAGKRQIVSPTTLTVCPGGCDYTSIQNAYNAIVSPLTNGYLIELQSTYTDASEPAGGIVFSAKAMSGYFITLRPAAGAPELIVDYDPGANTHLWRLDGTRNIIIDGRPGGTGTARGLTLRNTRTTGTDAGSALFLQNDASANILRYLNMESECVISFSGGAVGVVQLSAQAGSTGCDNNTIEYCFISDLTLNGSANMPWGAIGSGSSGSLTNDNNSVIGCELVNVFRPASITISYEPGFIVARDNATAWMIKDNHFYHTIDYPGLDNNSFSFISLESGNNHTIRGNFLGGKATGCGGAPLTITSGNRELIGINFGTAVTGNNVIENNTISNILYTTTYASTSYPLQGIRVAGTGNYTIGSAGKGNLIGSNSGTGSFRLTHKGTAGEGIAGIVNNSTGTVTVSYNNIGAITQDGTFAGADAVMILSNSASGSVAINDNIIGSSSAGDNILMSSNSNLYGISNIGAGGITCTNNTIKYMNYQILSATSLYGISNTAGSFTCTGNIISNISSNYQQFMISHNGTTATISSNTIRDISETGNSASAIFHGIYINSSSIVSVSSNAIGSSAIDNIALSGNSANYGIYKTGTGTLNSSNNSVQQFSLSNTSSGTYFKGIFAFAGVLNSTADTVQNITYAGSNVTDEIAGIEIDVGAATGGVVSKATVKNINCTNAGLFNIKLQGINLFVSSKVEKSFVSGLKNSATGTGTYIAAIYLEGNCDVFNNVVILDNGANTNTMDIYGIEDKSTGTTNIYHNTVKMSGSQAGGALGSYCFFRWSAGTDIVKNNLFQNNRTGGTYGHYAIYASVTTGTFTEDFDYLETTDLNTLGFWSGIDKNFSDWNIVVGASNNLNGTTVLNAIGKAPTSFIGANAGTNLTATVPEDKEDIPRHPTNPWMGAYETGYSINSITTSAITPTSICAGGTVNVPYTVTGTYNPGNIFTAQLSDAAGSFAAPVNVGTLNSQTNGTINAEIPSSTPAGAGYRIRVVSSNPTVIGADNGTNLSISVCLRYWVGSAGNWNDTNHWSDVSGGSPLCPTCDPIPHKGVHVYINNSSFTGPGQVITLPAGTWYMKTINLSGYGQTAVIVGQGAMVVGQ